MRPRELLARGDRLLPGANQLGVSLGGEHLSACLVELVHGTCLLQLAGQLRRGFGVGLSLTERRHDLACRDCAQISAPRLGRHAQCLFRGAKLGWLRIDRRRSWCAPAWSARVSRLPMICRSMSSSTGVETSEKAKLKDGGLLALTASSLGDAEPVIGRLQAEIVEKRDLHRGVGAERPVQQFRHARTRCRRIFRRADLHDVLVQAGACDRSHHLHPAVRREGPARAERCGRGDEDREAHAPKVREHGSSLVCR